MLTRQSFTVYSEYFCQTEVGENLMSKKHSGFTLIELIVVIVILGILAATALPKYIGIQSGARVSILQGARGAVASAINIASATQQALSLNMNSPVTLDGAAIAMVNRYPAGKSAGTISNIYAAAGLSADFSAVNGATFLTIEVLNAATPATCAFSYTEATATVPPVITTPVTAGC